METEVKTDSGETNGNNNQQETMPTDGDTAANSAKTNTEPTTDSKKENRSSDKDSGRDSSRGSRRDRDRGSRSRRRSRSRSPIRSNRASSSKRVYVANIPFDVKWTELKDLFRDTVGNVRFCQLFEDENGRARGCGLVEFDDPKFVRIALEKLDRHEIRGRQLVVKEDLDIERDRCGRLILPSSRREGRDRDRPRPRDHFDDQFRNGSSGSYNTPGSYNTYGLSPEFLSSLGIRGPLNNRVFVANLDYKVTERKLEDVFKLAGKVTKAKLYVDQNGRSKGVAVVTFDHPVEAVQAISMFQNSKLFDRIISVRLDKFDSEDPYSGDASSSKSFLPSGLEGIGKGLGIGGQPLNIAKGMLNNQQGPMNPLGGAQVSPGLVSPSNVVVPQAASAAIAALTNLAGNLQNLPNLAQSLAQLSGSAVGPIAGGPMANSSIAPSSGYPYDQRPTDRSASNLPPNPTYGGYQSYPPPPANGNPQHSSSYASNQMAPAHNYGPPPSVASSAPYASSVPASSSSYSTYDQRDYREDKYRGSSNDTVYVRNLPPTFNISNLRARFSEIGDVIFAEMKGHGTALITMAHNRDAIRACELMNGIRIENRPIDVDMYY